MRKYLTALVFILLCHSAVGSPGGFCSTGMAGSEDKPFVVDELAIYSGSSSDQYFRDAEHIFKDCIVREHRYERSDAICYKYAEVETAARELEKWVKFWEGKGREVVQCDTW